MKKKKTISATQQGEMKFVCNVVALRGRKRSASVNVFTNAL